MEVAQRQKTKKKNVITGLAFGLVILIGGCIFAWRAIYALPIVKIPEDISGKLLFTPYVPGKLPSGYSVNPDTFKQKESALLFAAYNKDGDALIFSEQAVPKDFDTNSFYETGTRDPVRLRSTTYPTIFGRKVAQSGSIVGVITRDSTWVIISSDKQLDKQSAVTLSNNLKKQQ